MPRWYTNGQLFIASLGVIMDKDNFVLAVLAASEGATLTPVQVQKLFFLLDEKIAQHVGGKHFNFQAYDYGPFDKQVYRTLERLSKSGLTEIVSHPKLKWNSYRLAPQGQECGLTSLSTLPRDVANYVRDLSSWVRSMPFADLVTAIYQEFPEMKANSVFRE